jgi:hypothetical protein
VVEHVPSKHDALTSNPKPNPRTTKNQKCLVEDKQEPVYTLMLSSEGRIPAVLDSVNLKKDYLAINIVRCDFSLVFSFLVFFVGECDIGV